MRWPAPGLYARPQSRQSKRPRTNRLDPECRLLRPQQQADRPRLQQRWQDTGWWVLRGQLRERGAAFFVSLQRRDACSLRRLRAATFGEHRAYRRGRSCQPIWRRNAWRIKRPSTSTPRLDPGAEGSLRVRTTQVTRVHIPPLQHGRNVKISTPSVNQIAAKISR